MLSINQMPPDARVWVFQSNRELTEVEIAAIENAGTHFIADWTAHGASLKASFNVLYNHFIVLSVDEQQAAASGCSIDKGIHFVKELEKHFNINLLDRLQVAYRNENEIITCHLSEFEKLAAQKIITESTIVFNNMVVTKASFEKEWEVPLKQSWQSRVLS